MASGLTHAKSVIIEFPMSKVSFEQLPPHYFPITPISWSFATKINGNLIRANRQQLPIQPAFAVTGHSAEGKTLPNVLADLHEGGFAAYVVASRPTSREGLCLSRPVSLEMLNRPLPYDLHIELQRLKIMEHNTLIRYGFEEGIEQPVFHPETESQLSAEHNIIRPKFELAKTKPKTSQDKKRKAINDDSTPKKKRKHGDVTTQHTMQTTKFSPTTSKKRPASTFDNLPTKSKKAKITHKTKKHNISSLHDPLPAGCIWSQTDWSCAYDVFFMIFFFIHHSSTELWKTSWSNYSSLASMLHECFSRLSMENRQMHRPDFINTEIN